MKESTSKEKILKFLRDAQLNQSAEETTSWFHSKRIAPIAEPRDADLSVRFAQLFSSYGYSFYYSNKEEDLLSRLLVLSNDYKSEGIACYNPRFYNFLQSLEIPNVFLAETEERNSVGIFLCENLIAQDASLVFTEKQEGLNVSPEFPETMLVLAFTSQVVASYKDALLQMKLRYKDAFPEKVINLIPEKEKAGSQLILLLNEDQNV